MRIGVPKETKNNEYRIGMTPSGVAELVGDRHIVMVEKDGGCAAGFTNEDYLSAGAAVVDTAEEIFDRAEMIIKVKEPQPQECRMLRPHQTLFTYLHLAPDPEQTRLLIASGATCIAYETVTSADGSLPLLTPMSEVAGRMAAQEAAHCLQKAQGGKGTLPSGVPGVPAANFLIIGGGVVGINAARIALGMGARVTLADRCVKRLQEIDTWYGGRLQTMYSSRYNIERLLPQTDAVIGAVLVPGAAAPKLITREMLDLMQQGSVLVDVAIDQGGCFETSKPTMHKDPTFQLNGIIHYCVANMPGAVARTSTLALTNVTQPFIKALANQGVLQALINDPHLLAGLNVHRGLITLKPVSQAQGHEYVESRQALESTIGQNLPNEQLYR